MKHLAPIIPAEQYGFTYTAFHVIRVNPAKVLSRIVRTPAHSHYPHTHIHTDRPDEDEGCSARALAHANIRAGRDDIAHKITRAAGRNPFNY